MAGELVDRMGEALTALPATSRYDNPFEAAINQLVRISGSVNAAAARIGVHPDSLRRYRRGARRPKDGGRAVIAALRSSAIRPGMQAAIRNGSLGMSIRGDIVVSGDSRNRTIHPGRYIPAGTMDRIVRTWKKGDDAKAEKMMYNALDKYYVNGIQLHTIEKVEFVP